jgi:hypothetical protein
MRNILNTDQKFGISGLCCKKPSVNALQSYIGAFMDKKRGVNQ